MRIKWITSVMIGGLLLAGCSQSQQGINGMRLAPTPSANAVQNSQTPVDAVQTPSPTGIGASTSPQPSPVIAPSTPSTSPVATPSAPATTQDVQSTVDNLNNVMNSFSNDVNLNFDNELN